MTNEPSFSFEEITIRAPRYRGGQGGIPSEIDITTSVIELNLYESIYIPYITGTLTLIDTNGVIGSLINIQGQEYLRVVLNINDERIEREYIIRRIQTQTKSIGNNSSTYVLDIIEEHGYLSFFKRLKKSYSGNIGEIISAVYHDELNNEIELMADPVQNVKVLACNRTPLGFCRWLIDRATDENGSPMFLYSSIKEGTRLNSLTQMLNDKPLDVLFAHVHIHPHHLESRAPTTIRHIKIEDNDDIITLAQNGAMRSTYISIDPLTASVDYLEFDMIDHHNTMFGDDAERNTMFVEDFEIGGERVADLPSTYISQINTSSMYANVNAYDEDALSNHLKKVSSKADILMLDKQRYEITLNGDHFLKHEMNTSIGVVIDVYIPKDTPSYDGMTNDEVMRDLKRSGEFLITNARHTFNIDNEYLVVASIARLAQPDNINEENRTL